MNIQIALDRISSDSVEFEAVSVLRAWVQDKIVDTANTALALTRLSQLTGIMLAPKATDAQNIDAMASAVEQSLQAKRVIDTLAKSACEGSWYALTTGDFEAKALPRNYPDWVGTKRYPTLIDTLANLSEAIK